MSTLINGILDYFDLNKRGAHTFLEGYSGSCLESQERAYDAYITSLFHELKPRDIRRGR